MQLDGLVLLITSLAAFIALIFSFTTAYIMFKYVRPIAKKLRPAAEKLGEYDPHALVESFDEMKTEAFEFVNEAGTQAVQGIQASLDKTLEGFASILQGEGAKILGKKGREKSLANAQIKAGKEAIIMKGLEEKFGPMAKAGVQLLENQGYSLDDVQGLLEMAQGMGINPAQMIPSIGASQGGAPSPAPPNSPVRGGGNVW